MSHAEGCFSSTYNVRGKKTRQINEKNRANERNSKYKKKIYSHDLKNQKLNWVPCGEKKYICKEEKTNITQEKKRDKKKIINHFIKIISFFLSLFGGEQSRNKNIKSYGRYEKKGKC